MEQINIKLDYNDDELKEFVKKIIKESSTRNILPYQTLITAGDPDSFNYEVFYKGKQIHNCVEIVLDNRKEK